MSEFDPDKPIDLLGIFGLTAPGYLPDEAAPPVNRELLEGLARRELSQEQARAAIRLVNMFRSWRETFTEIAETRAGSIAEEEWNKLVQKATPWLSAQLRWPAEPPLSTKAIVAVIILSMPKTLRLSLPGITRRESIGKSLEASGQDLEHAFASGSPFSLQNSDQWLHWMPTSSGVDIRVGHGPADAFPEFTLEFWAGHIPIATYRSERGVVHLNLERLLAAAKALADEVCIMTP